MRERTDSEDLVEFLDGLRSPEDYLRLSAELADIDARRVGLARLAVRGVEYRVSTVFLIVPHPGGPWETMVFWGEAESRAFRYRSREDAAIGHARIVTALRSGVPVEDVDPGV